MRGSASSTARFFARCRSPKHNSRRAAERAPALGTGSAWKTLIYCLQVDAQPGVWKIRSALGPSAISRPWGMS